MFQRARSQALSLYTSSTHSSQWWSRRVAEKATGRHGRNASSKTWPRGPDTASTPSASSAVAAKPVYRSTAVSKPGYSTPVAAKAVYRTPAAAKASSSIAAAAASKPLVNSPAESVSDALDSKPVPGHNLADGLLDVLPEAQPVNSLNEAVDWSRSFHGLSSTAFSPEAIEILLGPINPDDVEIKPDGIVYLPEIKYRRILNRAFGPGAWGLAPRGETIVTPKSVTREYGLVVHGRLVSIARGEQQYFDPEGIPTATEGCKSNALMRCCKDLGIASELWDPVFIRKYMASHTKEIWVEHLTTKRKKKMRQRKDVSGVPYPYQEVKS